MTQDKYRFEKHKDDKWYIVLPEWTGEKYDLEMVCGADIMLDLLSNNEKFVELYIKLEPFEHDLELHFIKEEYDGGWYNVKPNIDLNVWLCSVTKYVFGFLPTKIYFKVV